jgi:hypothetical protein
VIAAVRAGRRRARKKKRKRGRKETEDEDEDEDAVKDKDEDEDEDEAAETFILALRGDGRRDRDTVIYLRLQRSGAR